MQIVHLLAEDWERAREIRMRSLRDVPDAFGATLESVLSKSPERWQEQLSSPEAATFVAVMEGQDVGMAVGAKYECEGELEGAGLFGMWVAREARGVGAGDALVQAVVGWARSNGYERVVLDVGDWNEPAIALYVRHGFETTGVVCTLPPPRDHVTEHQRALVLGE